MNKESDIPDLLKIKANSIIFLPLKKSNQGKKAKLTLLKRLFLIFFSILALKTSLLGLNIDEKNTQINLSEELIFSEELVVLNGNSLLPIASLPDSDLKIVRKMSVVVTAYSSTPWETWGDPFVTAAGTWVKDGIIANNLLPFGTKVRMPEIYGDKIFIVEDRMNSRKGNYHFDVWFPSYWQAKEFGAKRTYIEVLEG